MKNFSIFVLKVCMEGEFFYRKSSRLRFLARNLRWRHSKKFLGRKCLLRFTHTWFAGLWIESYLVSLSLRLQYFWESWNNDTRETDWRWKESAKFVLLPPRPRWNFKPPPYPYAIRKDDLTLFFQRNLIPGHHEQFNNVLAVSRTIFLEHLKGKDERFPPLWLIEKRRFHIIVDSPKE